MLTFFRKIRSHLIGDSRIGKYLIYAIGEIALVVIGILIALQLNNWNQQNQRKLREITMLEELKSDLEYSLMEVNQDLKSSKAARDATQRILHLLKGELSTSDSLYYDFHKLITFNNFFPKSSAYETVKSIGLDAISNDSLRIMITNIYELSFSRILKKEDTRRNANKILYPY
ncbi:MAG: DUF6090 family protein, partial [Melioribacteraceae bacterium]|nr:DUF6090 family protein [Melioribacteraceae bacterium]